MEYKHFKLNVKKLSDQGEFEGYAAVKGNIDSYGDIIQDNAFKRTIQNQKTFPILWMHDPAKPVGISTHIEEDRRGLFTKGKIDLSTETGKMVYSGLKNGYVTGMSIGYKVIKDDMNKEGHRLLKEVKLLEYSLITKGFAANELAMVSGFKAKDMMERLTKLERVLESREDMDSKCGCSAKRSKRQEEMERRKKPRHHDVDEMLEEELEDDIYDEDEEMYGRDDRDNRNEWEEEEMGEEEMRSRRRRRRDDEDEKDLEEYEDDPDHPESRPEQELTRSSRRRRRDDEDEKERRARGRSRSSHHDDESAEERRARRKRERVMEQEDESGHPETRRRRRRREMERDYVEGGPRKKSRHKDHDETFDEGEREAEEGMQPPPPKKDGASRLMERMQACEDRLKNLMHRLAAVENNNQLSVDDDDEYYSGEDEEWLDDTYAVEDMADTRGRHRKALSQGDSSFDTLFMEAKEASGSTSLPLAPPDHAWNGPAAQRRIFKWAGEKGEDGFDPKKVKNAFFYCDPKNPRLKGSYKLPFADVINGKLYAVPRALSAVEGALNGARGGVEIPSSDKGKIRSKVNVYKKRMGDGEKKSTSAMIKEMKDLLGGLR